MNIGLYKDGLVACIVGDLDTTQQTALKRLSVDEPGDDAGIGADRVIEERVDRIHLVVGLPAEGPWGKGGLLQVNALLYIPDFDVVLERVLVHQVRELAELMRRHHYVHGSANILDVGPEIVAQVLLLNHTQHIQLLEGVHLHCVNSVEVIARLLGQSHSHQGCQNENQFHREETQIGTVRLGSSITGFISC